MTFEELQNGILRVAKHYSQRYEVEIDQDFALLKLNEEVGEYTQSVLIHRGQSKPEKQLPYQESKKRIANELADIIGMAIVNAALFDINLEQAIKEKWLSKL
jgi:NTP pyrophosphatase (non-canonical NTP hydrolase)